MADFSIQEIYEKFHKEIEENYPNLSLNHIKDICSSSWDYLKERMESEELPKVRFKYLGVFNVRPARAKLMLHKSKNKLEKDLITEERYKEIKRSVNNLIKRENEK